MAVNKIASKVNKFFVLQITFFLLKFVRILSAGAAFVILLFLISIISSHPINESSLTLFLYLPF